ncbi:mechanosensitive ion channel family protein [Haloprofundus salinisoli]|uniref:mechanosensitive ion channel family protein n=1 Tax=Haloprofundus salinisoli TaxID=2876193 RepID=UPI001CCD29E5|nr:mechanosensitive ion channel family protein [Haloprofundus salinisoli]
MSLQTVASVALQTISIEGLTLGGLIQQYLIPVVLFVVGVAVTLALGRLVLVPLVDRVLRQQGHDETVRSLSDSIMAAVVWVLALAVGLMLAGFGTAIAALGVFGGALALAVGFAAQDLLGNFVAGIFILKDKPFEVGDWIEVGDITGRVEDIDLRVTRIRTFDNERITVPNGELANNPLKNPVAYDRLRQQFVFGIGYEDDIEHAKEAILDEVGAVPEVLYDPAPDVRVNELADSYVGLNTRFWVDNPNRSDFVRVQSDVVQNVKERLDAEGIDMPYPYRQLTGSVDVDGSVTTQDAQTPADD